MMMNLNEIFLSCVLLGLIFYLTIKYFGKRHSRLPPGPAPLPLIGNLHQMGDHLHETFAQLSKKYTPIFTFRFGELTVVVINDFPTAKEVLVKRGAEFAGRSMDYTTSILTSGGKDIISGDYGKSWKFHRKIAHSALRMFGDGMSKLENVISNEVERLCQRFEECENVPFDPAVDIQLMVMNIICSMLFGGTFQREDPKFIKFKDHVHYLTNEMDVFALYDVISILQWLPWKEVRKLKEMRREMGDFLYDKLEMEQKNTEDKVVGDDIKVTNYVQALLKAKKEAEEEDRNVKEYLTKDHLTSTMFDLFIAGAETTSTTLKWCLLYMTMWPKCQRKVQMELDGEVGKPDRGKLVGLSDRPNLPYLEAVVMETQRLGSIAPLGLFHKTTKDTTLHGYEIPKGTGIVVNLWALHHDESYWKKPFEFDPTRFLDADGKIIKDSSRPYIPFSAGPRVCLGETLARTELFLCISNLFHRFEFALPSQDEKPSLQGKSSTTLCPEQYRIIVKKRY